MFDKYRPPLVPGLVATIVLTACSASGASQATDVPNIAPSTEANTENSSGVMEEITLDACLLVTQAEAEGVLGESTGPGERTDTPPFYVCDYQTASTFNKVSIVVIQYSSSAEALGVFQYSITNNGYPEISGVGDRAYNSQPIGDITVLLGDKELSIDIFSNADDAAQLQSAIELAKLAITRMP
jgi:hypothetical protein